MTEVQEKALERMFNPSFLSIVRHRITRICTKITRVASGIKMLWENEDWDHYYIFEILKWKLERVEKYIRLNDRHTTAQKDAKKMRTAIALIMRINDQNYTTPEYSVALSEKYNFNKFIETGDEMRTLQPVPVERIKQVERALEYGYKHRQYMEEQDYDMLFSILKKNIRKWWD